MKPSQQPVKSILMMAYTNYRTDPRVIREAEAAVSAGYAVDFLALRQKNDPDMEMIRGVRVIHLNQYRYRGSGHTRYVLAYLQFFMRCLLKASYLFLRRRYGVIHVNNMPDFLVFCTVIAKLGGAKVILDIHDPMPDTFTSKFKSGEKGLVYRLLLWQELASAWYTDRLITVHDPVKDHILVKKHGLPAASIQVIANFADDQLFKLRESYSINGKVRLIFHGTILERYGLRQVMLALAGLQRKDNISVRIIGEGDFSKQLTELIAELGLADVVQFDNHLYPLNEIPQVIADCNVGLVPLELSSIINYALPLKLLEYISLGLPVVTVRTEAIGYYFSENDCLYYQPDDPDSLRALLDQLAENPGLLLQYRERTLVMREKFLWSNEKRKYVDLLQELSNKA